MLGFLIPAIIIGATIALSWPLGRYMRWAMDPTNAGPSRLRYERRLRRHPGAECNTRAELEAVLPVDVGVQRGDVRLRIRRADYAAVVAAQSGWERVIEPSLAFNTAASFTSNTNLQHYSGEASLSYFSQLFALMWLQFVSAATGVAAVAALCRGLAGRTNLGNFFQDLWRATGLVFLPLAVIGASLLILCGMPMTLQGSAVATTLEGVTQTIARGPVAAFVMIKQLGTNGGGWFGPNCTHPFENPTFWSNVVCNVAIILIPMGTVWMFGWITGRIKHAAVIFGVMLVLYLSFLTSACVLETRPTAALAGLPVEQAMNLEGKELRFGTTAGATWAVSTTVTSNGSVDAMHDSLNPLTGLLPMCGMWLNCIFGGVGVGLINMFLFIVTAVFLAGMMVGRTPEYLTRSSRPRK